MTEIPAIDAQISDLADWVLKAGESLRLFYNEDKGAFWRNNSMIRKDNNLHPTATNRSLFALYEYLRFLYEEDLQRENSAKETTKALEGTCQKYIPLVLSGDKEARESKTNGINMFTDSQILISLATLENVRAIIKANLDPNKIKNVAKKIADENLRKLEEWKGGKVHPGEEVHHFVTLHIIRALDSCCKWHSDLPTKLMNDLSIRVKEDTLRFLAYRSANVNSKYDPAELTFCIALLNRFQMPDSPLMTECSIRSIADSQSKDGTWPTARYVSYEAHGILHVSSYEVALTLTQFLSREIYRRNMAICKIVLPALDRAFEMVKSSFNTVEGISGWANDHARQSGLIESWATATVLSFLVDFRDVLLNLRQQLILQKYECIPPDDFGLPYWPDRIPSVRQAQWIDMNIIDSFSDPTDNAEIIKSIKDAFVKPIADDWTHRPQVTSLILYGPPGTRKTTLMMLLARGLRWPLLILTPSDLLREGLEGFEATTAKIFDDIRRLRRVIVLLDECEQFFKARPKTEKLESRTIGAFITAGMLPRLQLLHDIRWVVFVLATNVEPYQLDKAVSRQGRFDYGQRVDYPSLKVQVSYVETKMENAPEKSALLKRALEKYDQGRDKKKQVSISFSILDRLIREISGLKKGTDQKKIFSLLEELVDVKHPPPLTHRLKLD